MRRAINKKPCHPGEGRGPGRAPKVPAFAGMTLGGEC